jgi:imidazolonepropionase
VTRTLIRGARQVLTLRGAPTPRRGTDLQNLGIVEDGSILIEDGKIRDVGSTHRIENLAVARGAIEIPAYGRVLMPGFIDCSTQLVSGPRRAPHGAEDSDPIGAGLRSTRDATAARLEADATATLRRCLQYGTTAIEARSGAGLDEASELKLLRAIAHLRKEQPLHIISTFFGASRISPERAADPNAYIDELIAKWLPVIHQKDLASFIAVSCDRSTFDHAQCRRVLAAAKRFSIPAKVHTGITGTSQGVSLAVEFEARTAEYLHHLSERDIAMLAASEIIAVVTPSFRFHEPSGAVPPARKLIESGAALAIASGYDRATSPSFSLPMAIATACHELHMPPSEGIAAATINAAHAIGRAGSTGSIEPGKDANLLILETSDYRDLAYESGINPVYLTMIRGEIVCRNTTSFTSSLSAFAG